MELGSRIDNIAVAQQERQCYNIYRLMNDVDFTFDDVCSLKHFAKPRAIWMHFAFKQP